MITLQEYFRGFDKTHAQELTEEIRTNAEDMVRKVNDLLGASGFNRRVSSGWRPSEVNKAIPNAATRSKHMVGNACDLEDKDGKLDAWCMANFDELERIGLWVEHPSATKGWCHVQRVPPKSGRRVFYP